MLFLINRSNSKNLSSSLFSNFGVGQSTFSSFSSTSTKRTFLLSRRIGPTFFVRSLYCSWRTVGSNVSRRLAENSNITNGIRKAGCAGIQSRYGQPTIPRRHMTYDQKKLLNAQGYDIKIMNSGKKKDSHINGHYALYESETDSNLPYTHWKDSDGKKENPIVCCGDIINNPAYTAEKSFLQRLAEPTLHRCVNANWVQLSRINFDQVMVTIKMRKIMRKDPVAFAEFQNYYRKKIHDNKNLDFEEKNGWAQFFFESFIEWQDVKNRNL